MHNGCDHTHVGTSCAMRQHLGFAIGNGPPDYNQGFILRAAMSETIGERHASAYRSKNDVPEG